MDTIFSRPLLTLRTAASLRRSLHLTRPAVAACTGIPLDRIADIEHRKVEPWLDEAILITRLFCLSHILPLLDPAHIGSTQLTTSSLLSAWHSPARLSLTQGVFIARLFGLPDPMLLDQPATARQLWELVGVSERTPIPHRCPVCARSTPDPHLPTCYGHNLFGALSPLDRAHTPALGQFDDHNMSQAKGLQAHGLRALRLGLGLDQAQMAAKLGYSRNHYAMMERGQRLVNGEKAARMAQILDIDRALLFLAPQV